jgi:hypothetical protein
VKSVLPVVRLQFARRRGVLLVPLLIVAITFAVTVVIQVTLQRSGAYDDGASYATGARFNPGVVWAQAAWLRFGPRGPLGISIGVVLVLAVALLAAGPSLPAVFANYESWWAALTAALLAAAAIAGTFAFLRRASVR